MQVCEDGIITRDTETVIYENFAMISSRKRESRIVMYSRWEKGQKDVEMIYPQPHQKGNR